MIVPAYNSSQWILHLIEAIQKQTWQNWELIIINDGSTDNTEEICIKECKKDNRIKLFKQENAGPSAARNLGLQKCNGEYYTIVDSDDLLVSNALETYMHAAIKYNADTVIAGYEIRQFNHKEQQILCVGDEYKINIQDSINTPEIAFLIKKRLMASNWNKLYRYTLKNIKFNTTISLNEDVLYSLQALKASKTIAVIPDILYIYRIINTTSLSLRFHKETPDSLDYLYNEFADKSGDVIMEIKRWLMNSWFVYTKIIIKDKKMSDKEKYFYIKEAKKSKVFKNCINFRVADSMNRKFCAILLKIGLKRVYFKLLKKQIEKRF